MRRREDEDPDVDDEPTDDEPTDDESTGEELGPVDDGEQESDR